MGSASSSPPTYRTTARVGIRRHVDVKRIVTNAHAVRAPAARIKSGAAAGTSILAAHSRTVKGQVVGIDLETDLAVVKIDEHKLPVVLFGDSDELSAGNIVLAMGSPLGFQNSVSLGVVSAVARQLEPESPMIYVQTDAAINPGRAAPWSIYAGGWSGSTR